MFIISQIFQGLLQDSSFDGREERPAFMKLSQKEIRELTVLHPGVHQTAEILKTVGWLGPPLWSSGQSFWLQIQRSRVRSPALPDFLSSSGSGTGSTQPREVN